MSGIIVLDREAETDDAIGTYPDQRTIEQRLESGFFLLDKGAVRPRIKSLHGFETCLNYQDWAMEAHLIHLLQAFFH